MIKIGRARSTFVTVIAAVIILALAGTTGAVAGGLITSKKIKNNTIKSIDVRNGTLTAADMAPGTIPMPYGGSYAYSKFHDASVDISPTAEAMSLPIPQAGNYVIDATYTARNLDSARQIVVCTLAAGGDNDVQEIWLPLNGSLGGHRESMAQQVVHGYAAPGVATLSCDGGANTDVLNIKMTAIKVDHLSNTAG
jgi:hypothetical protein